jgi:hypothetical protein
LLSDQLEHHRGHERLVHAADLVAQPRAHRPRRIEDRQAACSAPGLVVVSGEPDGTGRAGCNQLIQQLLELVARQLGAACLGASGWRCGPDHQECSQGHDQDRYVPARPPFRHWTLAVARPRGAQPLDQCAGC